MISFRQAVTAISDRQLIPALTSSEANRLPRTSPMAEPDLVTVGGQPVGDFGFAGCFLRLSQLYFFWNFSTRPVVSTNFILPVKNGWQAEQISTVMFFSRAAGGELVAATAGHGRFDVFGMNAFLHDSPHFAEFE